MGWEYLDSHAASRWPHKSSLQPLPNLPSISEHMSYSIKKPPSSRKLTITNHTILANKVAVPSRYRRHIPLSIFIPTAQ